MTSTVVGRVVGAEVSVVGDGDGVSVVGDGVFVVVGAGVPEVVGLGVEVPDVVGDVVLVRVAFCSALGRPGLVGFSWTSAPSTPAAPPPDLAMTEIVRPGGVVGLLPFPLPLVAGLAPASGAETIAAAVRAAAAIFHFI